MDTDKTLHRSHETMIKSVTILFKVEINVTICTTNKLYGKYNYFIHFKI